MKTQTKYMIKNLNFNSWVTIKGGNVFITKSKYAAQIKVKQLAYAALNEIGSHNFNFAERLRLLAQISSGLKIFEFLV